MGTLLGDCLGAPFEGEPMTAGGKVVLNKYFDKLDGPYFNAPVKQYTDDTAMTKSVAKCLIDKPAVDFKCLARLFVKEYFSEPRRGYGQNVVEVFSKLRGSKFEDIYKPAREQFSGRGSYGNGGAMRVAPMALYFHNNYKGMIEAATHATEITHTHKLGINGALLQCIALQQTLLTDPVDKIDVEQFTNQLIDKMKVIEATHEEEGDEEHQTAYQEKLKMVQELLTTDQTSEFLDKDHNVIVNLGNNVSAFGSVPTAIYCFLKAQNEISGIKTDNTFRRTIQYAVSLGGDTDTIASMAGGLAGAFLGEEYINESLIKHCEYQKEMLEIADNLFAVTEGSSKPE